MTALAATATVLILIGAGSWVISLLQHPFTVCGRCNGSGRNAGSNGSHICASR